ncbi:uncharacterized protein LOC144349667 [Saccoglossus kowalevskii]
MALTSSIESEAHLSRIEWKFGEILGLLEFYCSRWRFTTFSSLFFRLFPYNIDHYELATGNYRAVVVQQLVPVDKIKPLLPNGLELMEDMIQDGRYVVLYTFGEQSQVQPVFGGITLAYLESIMAVPYVTFSAELREKYKMKTPLTFLPQLYVNNTLGLMLGRMYGLAKFRGQLTAIENDIKEYHVMNSETNTLIVNVTWQPSTSWKLPKAFPFSKTYIEGALELPIIGNMSLGFLQCCSFDWKFHESKIRGVKGEIHFQESFTSDVPTGRVKFEDLKSGQYGAYEIDSHWSLSFPYIVPKYVKSLLSYTYTPKNRWNISIPHIQNTFLYNILTHTLCDETKIISSTSKKY